MSLLNFKKAIGEIFPWKVFSSPAFYLRIEKEEEEKDAKKQKKRLKRGLRRRGKECLIPLSPFLQI